MVLRHTVGPPIFGVTLTLAQAAVVVDKALALVPQFRDCRAVAGRILRTASDATSALGTD